MSGGTNEIYRFTRHQYNTDTAGSRRPPWTVAEVATGHRGVTEAITDLHGVTEVAASLRSVTEAPTSLRGVAEAAETRAMSATVSQRPN